MKTNTLGYDGHGKFVINSLSDLKKDWCFTADYILEKKINLKKEISVIIARYIDGTLSYYEPIENVHKNQIPLEICPTSNIQCGAYNNMQNHSFGKLYNANFNVTINTDNRLMSNITMSEEIENVVKFFDLNQKDINQITKKTIEAGFCNEDKRLSLIEKI